ncbi:hypothetical protein TBR22_A18600 [Luteitalea sp. TBR-22]|uniref:hypothetical protein n=1 Tax=Luteitalea sp. TBR-22 TaxID=2802971 RepID=UPI001AF359D6|nr:hypothetical protein [Luteitalea sp. TBR-22]BCS32646.1 hypothetical protein TBR22_A18600 [Luteitalea sp. TBR-22]
MLMPPDRRHFIGAAAMTVAAAGLDLFPRAGAAGPEALRALWGGSPWLNAPRPDPAALGGAVVAVQFGTFTCINWLRTLPHVRAWTQAYPQLTMVGVHTPEFTFERDLAHVRRSIARLALGYPMVVDNDYAIWRAFDNHSWPALYVFGKDGQLRRRHFGEGEYDASERAIRDALAEAGRLASPSHPGQVVAERFELQADWASLQSPEMYLGRARQQRFASPGGLQRGRRTYTAPTPLALNAWALGGAWTAGPEAAVAQERSARVACGFQARDLHLVMAPASDGTPIPFRVLLDGAPPGAAHGHDVDAAGDGVVSEPRLHQLIRQPQPIRARQFAIEFALPGAQVFSFTFG